MNKREAYRRSYEPRVQATAPKVQAFQQYTHHLSPSEYLRLKPQIDDVQLQLATLAMRLHNVTVATDAGWEEARDRAELAWRHFQRALDDAYAQTQGPPATRPVYADATWQGYATQATHPRPAEHRTASWS